MDNFETKFVYDERRKILTANKIWTIKGEKKIKEVVESLSKQKAGFEQSIKQVKERLEAPPTMTKEMQHLKDLLTDLQKIDIAEKMTKPQKIELKNQLNDTEKSLKEVSIEISKLKSEIGTRLKL